MHRAVLVPSYLAAACRGARHAGTPGSIAGRAYPAWKDGACAQPLGHRRLLADFAVAARGVRVRHLRHDGRIEEHRLSPGLRRRDDGLLVYDAGQPTLL